MTDQSENQTVILQSMTELSRVNRFMTILETNISYILEQNIGSAPDIATALTNLFYMILGKNVEITLFKQPENISIIPTDDELKLVIFYNAINSIRNEITALIDQAQIGIPTDQGLSLPIIDREKHEDIPKNKDRDYIIPISIGNVVVGHIRFIDFMKHIPKPKDGVTTKRFATSLSRFEQGIQCMLESPLNKTLYHERKESAERDPLTGVLNRGEMVKQIQRHINHNALHPNTKTPVLCMIDCDHFKQVNTEYGHAGGDKVLKQLTQIISGVLPPDAVFGRYGGEEFIVYIPNAVSQSHAMNIAESIRIAVENAEIEVERDVRIKKTVSIGVTLVTPEDDFDTAAQKADSGTEYSKRSGRNKVVYSDAINPDGIATKVRRGDR